MISALKRNNWFVVKILVFISIIIPLGIITYESVILGNDSVIFLAEYPSAIGIVVLIYYCLLLLTGILWAIIQLRSILNLNNEIKKNELLHLQSQVNPHFFFNMLNNIYGTIDKDSDTAKNLILKLSDLMRYSIYEGEKNAVSLQDEISYLKNYIDLHKMRYHKEIDIQLNTDIANQNLQIRPLLLIILLENAFKHGVENLQKKAYVIINLRGNKEKLIFEIENNFDEKEISKEKGIGLKNLKRRLELAYPKKHKLVIEKNNSVFQAKLELKL
jgi:two-component system, LytTR family, sensor histidine kinase AlgZ